MPNKNFHDLDFLSLIIVTITGIWGSIVAYLKRDRTNYAIIRKITAFLTDAFVTMGFTLLTYIGLIGYDVNNYLAVAIAGVIGHKGTRLTYLVELAIAKKLGVAEAIKEEYESK